jgi:hypothetical protein
MRKRRVNFLAVWSFFLGLWLSPWFALVYSTLMTVVFLGEWVLKNVALRSSQSRFKAGFLFFR